MEPRVAALEVRVENLEKKSDEHEDEDRRLHKYMTNMMEDLQAQLAGLRRSADRFEADLSHRSDNDGTIRDSMKEIFARLRTVERLIYIAVGGVIVTGGIVSIVGGKILGLLAR